MRNPKNAFKAALKSGQHQVGVWNSIGGPIACEIAAGAGFDWVCVDTEHAAVDVTDVLPALQIIAGYPDVSPVVRPAANDPILFKRLLDIGAQTLLVPYVESADEASAAVTAMRYGPRGIRGMAGATRATRFGQVDDYFTTAEEELCLIVQVETVSALEELEAIAKTDGVDGVFFGPADLSASMGLPGQVAHPDVVAAMKDAMARLRSWGVPFGTLSTTPAHAQDFISEGTAFTAVGVDSAMLTQAARDLRARF